MDDATYQRLLTKAQRTRDLFTFDQFLRFWAEDRPDRTALDADDLQFTFKQLEAATARVAGALTALGLQSGDRVSWFGKNSATYFTLFFGAARAGIVMVPVGWRLAERGTWRGQARNAAWIAEQMERGVLRAADPLIAAQQFGALCQGAVFHAFLLGAGPRPDPAQIRSEAVAAVDTFLRA